MSRRDQADRAGDRDHRHHARDPARPDSPGRARAREHAAVHAGRRAPRGRRSRRRRRPARRSRSATPRAASTSGRTTACCFRRRTASAASPRRTSSRTPRTRSPSGLAHVPRPRPLLARPPRTSRSASPLARARAADRPGGARPARHARAGGRPEPDPRDRARRRPLRQRRAQPHARASRAGVDRARAARVELVRARRALLRRRRAHVRRRAAPATSSSTRTATATSPSRSRAAARPSCSAIEEGSEILIQVDAPVNAAARRAARHRRRRPPPVALAAAARPDSATCSTTSRRRGRRGSAHDHVAALVARTRRAAAAGSGARPRHGHRRRGADASRGGSRTREVVGVDLAPAMIAEAETKLPPELAARVRFEVGDASAAPVRRRRLRARHARQHDPVLRRARPRHRARPARSSSRSRAAPRRRSTSRRTGSGGSSAAEDSRNLRTSRPAPRRLCSHGGARVPATDVRDTVAPVRTLKPPERSRALGGSCVAARLESARGRSARADELGRSRHWVRELAQRIYDDGYRPDMVLAIARGGMLVAAALGYALGVKNTFTMNVEFYTGVDARLEMPMILPPVPDLVDFHETRVSSPTTWPTPERRSRSSRSSAKARWRRCAARSSTRSRTARSGASTSGAAPTAGSPSRGARRTRSPDRGEDSCAPPLDVGKCGDRAEPGRDARVARAGLEPATPRFSAECSTS